MVQITNPRFLCSGYFEFGELFHKFRTDLNRVLAAGLADPIEFHNIKASLAKFNPADKRMFPPKPGGQLTLVQLGSLAHGNQLGSECLVKRRKR